MVFFGLSYHIATNDTLWYKWDFDMTVKIQDIVPMEWDRFLSLFSLVGNFEVISVILLGLVALKRQAWGFAGFGVYILAIAGEFLGKSLLYHPGPPFLFNRTQPWITLPSNWVHTDFAYPSGHALRSVFVAGYLLWLIADSHISDGKKFIGYLLTSIFIGLMLISRVSLGEHWPTDVIGGALAGAGCLFLVLAWRQRLGQMVDRVLHFRFGNPHLGN